MPQGDGDGEENGEEHVQLQLQLQLQLQEQRAAILAVEEALKAASDEEAAELHEVRR